MILVRFLMSEYQPLDSRLILGNSLAVDEGEKTRRLEEAVTPFLFGNIKERVKKVYPVAQLENGILEYYWDSPQDVFSHDPKLNAKIKSVISELNLFPCTEWKGQVLKDRDLSGANVIKAPCIKWLLSKCNYQSVLSLYRIIETDASEYGWRWKAETFQKMGREIQTPSLEQRRQACLELARLARFVAPILGNACYDLRTIFLPDCQENRQFQAALYLISEKRPAGWFDPMALGMDSEVV
jgi:hypothetical protein